MSINLAKAINRLGFIIKEPPGSIISYSVGTVTVAASVTVTGSGTTWLTNISAGQTFHVIGGKYYSILSVDSNTQLTLTEAYAGTPGAGVSYTVKGGRRPDAMKVEDLNSAQHEIVNTIEGYDENYFATTGTISYLSGTELYSLPTTNGVIKKILLVRRTDVSPEKVLDKINFTERNNYLLDSAFPPNALSEKRYRLGQSLGIVPIPTTSVTNNITIHYLPEATDFTTDSSTSILSDDWYDLLCYTAAIKSTDDSQVSAEQTRLWKQMVMTLTGGLDNETRHVNHKVYH